MSSIKRTARLAGLIYTVMAIMNILGFTHAYGRFVVPGDPAATVRKIADHETLYRIAIFNDYAAHILFLVLIAMLYDLFCDVNRRHALLMVLLVVVPVAAQFANLVERLAPLTVMDADYLSVFTKPQQDAIARGFLGLHSNSAVIAMAFWGLWLFPFALLVIKSGFFPRILGILLMAAGVGYTVVGSTMMVFPEHLQLVGKAMMPLYFGELPIVFWLLIKGAKEPGPAPRLSPSAA